MPDAPSGPAGQCPLQEPEPEASTVTMVTTTLHPVGPDDSHNFCNSEGSGGGVSMSAGFG